MTAIASVSFKSYHWMVLALAGGLGLLSVLDLQEAEVSVNAFNPPQDVVLLQSAHHMTRLGQVRAPGIIWSARDPVLDEDYPKDDQPGTAPEAPTEAPIPKLDTAPAPSKVYETPSPPPPLKVDPPKPGEKGPPWKWSQRDAILDHDYPKDEQPTATPGLLQLTSVEETRQKATQKFDVLMKSAAEPETDGDEKSEKTEAKEGEKTEAEKSSDDPKVGETETEPPVVKEGPSPEGGENSTNSSTTNMTTAAPESESSNEESTKCATKKDARATSWWLETASEGTPCVFGVDARDEGTHCVLDNEEFGSNGWCFTKEDKSEWGSCNDKCPLYGPNAAIGKMLDGVSESIQGVADKVAGNSSANDVDESTPPEGLPATNESVVEAPAEATSEPTEAPTAAPE